MQPGQQVRLGAGGVSVFTVVSVEDGGTAFRGAGDHVDFEGDVVGGSLELDLEEDLGIDPDDLDLD